MKSKIPQLSKEYLQFVFIHFSIAGLEFSTNASPISNFFRISIWTIPIKLLLDEDIIVRQMASNFVHKMQSYIMKTLPLNGCLINMELNWCGSPLVSLKAEEFLIDSYINLLKEANLFHLIPHMIIMALSSLCETQVSESYSTDEVDLYIFLKFMLFLILPFLI